MDFDVVIIGGGPGGYNCAIRCSQLGLKVACIESRPAATLGGTCLNVGCIPSKALLHASHTYAAVRDSYPALGVRVEGLTLDLPQMMRSKDETVAGLTKGIQFLLQKNKAKTLFGRGRITGPGQVTVTAADGGVTTLATKHIVIATGSTPTPLPGIPFDETRVLSSTGALALAAVPKKLIVVGAGVIGLELGSVWQRVGAEVVVVEALDQILPGTESAAAAVLQKHLRKQGLAFQLGVAVQGLENTSAGVRLTVQPTQGGETRSLDADAALVAIGRRPHTEGLGLDSVGIVPDRRGFITTDHWKTTVDGVWAIGDVTHGPMLAHKAEEEGVAVAESIAGRPGHVDYGVIPSVVYTMPELASVGRTSEQLKEAGVAFRTASFPFLANSRASANRETDGTVTILATEGDGVILGAHIVGPNAGEMIGEVCVAMTIGATAEDLARTCHAHPTLSEGLRQAAMGIDGWTMQA